MPDSETRETAYRGDCLPRLKIRLMLQWDMVAKMKTEYVIRNGMLDHPSLLPNSNQYVLAADSGKLVWAKRTIGSSGDHTTIIDIPSQVDKAIQWKVMGEAAKLGGLANVIKGMCSPYTVWAISKVYSDWIYPYSTKSLEIAHKRATECRDSGTPVRIVAVDPDTMEPV